MRNDVVKRGLNDRQKLLSQASTLPLIPQKRFLDVCGSRRTENGGHHRARPRIRRSTSSQGMPAGPSRSSSSSRRSSSSRCAWVSGTASGVVERLSQRSSNSWSRSSGLRLAMSMAAIPVRIPLFHSNFVHHPRPEGRFCSAIPKKTLRRLHADSVVQAFGRLAE